ncbi:MAG: hypothetical protein MJ179_00115 [Treponema sp.]|nr:hypothetical protein [Treponema sp.]
MKKHLLAFFIILLISLGNAYGQISIISPAEGKWCNKQMLVIDTNDTSEYFYSLNGEDPKTSGFAYDGPVLIDLTGDVTLRIQKATGKEEKVIHYFVDPQNGENESYSYFINSFYDTGIINYTAGSTISIPYDLYYSIGLGSESYIPGTDIYLSQDSVFSRCLPCEIYDPVKKSKWRFVIKVFPQNYGSFSKYEVPFSITDWDTINFEDKDLIYKIDDEYWELPKTSRKLDRSVPHTISWQSLAYEMGNPIEYFELPAKPVLTKELNYDGSIILRLDGNSEYKMSILSQPDNEYQELFYNIGIDTFYGDSISGTLTVGVFFNSVFQGELECSYELNKRPPKTPVISATNKSFYSRDDVSLVISGKENCDLYYSISEPFLLTDNRETYNPESSIFADVQMKDFVKADSSQIDFNLKAEGEGACYYAIRAYSKDGENVSQTASYSVVIDKYNYYYCEDVLSDLPDGTADHPYNSFKQFLDVVNKGRFAKVMIRGQMHIPSGKNTLLSNCYFINQEDGEIIFAEDSLIEVKSSTLQIEDFTILQENISSSSKNNSLFKLENAILDLNKCQIGASFSKNGNLADAFNSSVYIKDSVIAVSAVKYASVISGSKTNIKAEKSIINATAATSVIFSINNGTVKANENSFKVTGQIGRIFECFAVTGTITKNDFKSELTNKNSSVAVYTDKKCNITISENEDYGF